MRILYLSSELPGATASGGLGTFTDTIAKEMAARGHEVHVLVCASSASRRDVRLAGADGVRLHLRRVPQPPWPRPFPPYWYTRERLLSAATFLWEYLRLGARFDVVHAPEFMAPALFMAPFVKALVVRLSTPSLVLVRCEGSQVGRDHVFADWLESLAAREADVIITPTSMLVERLGGQTWLGKAGVRRLLTPVKLQEWQSNVAAEATGPIVLAVGKLNHAKAPDLLVEAAALLLGEVPDLRLVFVGQSGGTIQGLAYSDYLAKRAAELGLACSLAGEQPAHEVRRFYEEARLVVMPCRFDSFGNVGLEAMAAGRPVVCTSACGLSEIVERVDAVAVAPSEDVEALATSMRPYLMSPTLAGEVGRRSRELIIAEHSPSAAAESIEVMYLEALALGRTRLGRVLGRR